MVFANHDEIWHGTWYSTRRVNSLVSDLALIRRKMGTEAPKLNNLVKNHVYGGFHPNWTTCIY